MILKILKQQDPSTPNAVSDVLAKILTPIINKKQPIKDASKKPELNEKLKKGIMGAISFYMKTRKQSGGGVSLAGAGKYTSSYVKALKQNI